MAAAGPVSVLRWRGDWRTSFFVALFLPLFLLLGNWQLQRATEKELLSAHWQQRALAQPRRVETLDHDPQNLAYRPVTLVGEFLQDRYFLLDNRVYQGRYGMEVLNPFRLASGGELVIINRGWVPADPARRSLPEVLVPSGTQRMLGSVYVPPGDPYTLGPESSEGAWPRVLQNFDAAVVGASLGEKVFPYSVRIDSDEELALVADWPVVNVSPEKHRGYAVQWFCMALALLLIYVWRSTNLDELLRRKRGLSDE